MKRIYLLHAIVLSFVFTNTWFAQVDYSKYDIYQRAELKPNYIQAWSRDSIKINVQTSKCTSFTTKALGNVKTSSKVDIEIINNTGRDLYYKTQQTADIYIRHLAEWDDRIFADATYDSRALAIIITKQVIKGKDTLHVFPKGQTWTFEKRVSLLIPPSRKINEKSNYYAEYTASALPLTPNEDKVYDAENEKKEAFLQAKFKSVEKLNQKNGKVTIQFDIPLLKKYQLYINNELIGEFKRRDYYEFEFASNQKISFKTTTKKASKADINKEIEFKSGYAYCYAIHAFEINGDLKAFYDDYMVLINPNYIPKVLQDKGIQKENFTPSPDRITKGKTLP